ncbi:uncharacterized protein ACN2A1_014480 isoform 1-T2 [Glossina fuscipes fuscipes]
MKPSRATKMPQPKMKTIREAQQELASSLGFRDQIIWDFYSAHQSNVLEKKIKALLPDQPKNQRAIKKMRENLFTNVWKQRKYDNGTLYSYIFYVAVTNDKEPEKATKFSIHPVFRIRKCVAGGDSVGCCMIYVDETGRVYPNWESYINENILPPGLMVVPNHGVYKLENDQVVLASYTTPNGKPGAVLLQKAQKSASLAGMGAACVPLAAMAFPVVAPVAAGAACVSVATGIMSGVLSAKNLVDRSNHEQSIQITDRDACGSWLGVASGVVGPTSLGATKYMTRMATAGKATTGLEIIINGMNVTSMVLSGSGLGMGILDLIFKYKDGDDVTNLDVVQLAASLVLFTHSVYNFQMASNIADNARNGHIEKYRESLSRRQRKEFHKLSKETTRIRPGSQGKIDIVRNINEIPDRQYLNDLYKINKQLNQNKVRPAYASKGQGIVLNNDVKVDTHVLRQSVQHQKGPNVLKSVTKPIPETISTTAKVNFTAHNPTPIPNPFWNSHTILIANGAKICLEEFGSQFRENIYDCKEWNKLADFIASKFPEDVIRFLLNLSKTFIERLHKCRDMVFQKDTSTESILFRILKYCYGKLEEDQDFQYFRCRAEVILKHLDEFVKWIRKITKHSIKPDKNFPDSTTTEMQTPTDGAFTLSNPNEKFPGSFIVAENRSRIFLRDFELEFLINILDRNALCRITEFLCLNFSEKTVRFLFNTTRRIVDHCQNLNFEVRVAVTTESILFQIFKYWYTNFNDDIEHDPSKIDEIITNVRRYITNKKNFQNINDIPDKENLKELLKSKKQSKPNINTNTGRPSLRRNDILLNNDLNVGSGGTERQNGSNSLQSIIQSTPDNTSKIEDHNDDSENINSFTIRENGAMISLSEFGERFNNHIIDSVKLNGLIEYLCSNLSEETVRFLLKLAQSFIENYAKRIENKLKMILTTESVLFHIFKYCHNKYKENLNFENLRHKRDDIVTNTYFTLVPMDETDEVKKIKCQNCKGFYSISDL